MTNKSNTLNRRSRARVNSEKSTWDKVKEAFTNNTISAAMAENPAVMTAAGWSKDAKTGKMTQKQTAATDKLAENLSVISMLADGDGLIKTGVSLAKAMRHPVRTAKAIAQLAKDGVQAIKSGVKTATKVVKRSKVAKQLTAPARAKRAEKSAQELVADRHVKYEKYDKAARAAKRFQLKKAGRKSGITLERNKRPGGGKVVERRIVPNWEKITKKEDVKGVMKSGGTPQKYIDEVKMGPAVTKDGGVKMRTPYVEFKSKSGYSPNDFISDGNYEMPIFETGDVVKGTSEASGGSQVVTTRVTPPGFRNFTTTTNNESDITRTGFDELRKALQKDIDYLKKEVPGFKPFGSAEGVSEGALSHNTHDIDGYLSREAFEEFRKTHPVSERPGTSGNTYIYNVGDGKYGEAGNIDLNIIDIGKDGTINNSRTAELYRQFFPLEYQKQAQMAATKPGTMSLKALDANGKPISSQSLMDAYDPLTKTIMDAMEIDFHAGAKGKHAGRILEYFAGDRPDAVNKALQQTAKLAGEKGHLLPKMQFGSVDDNIALLDRIGFKGDVKAIANSPEKMQNVMDYWYLSGRSNIRQVNAGDINENGGTIQKLFRNLTDWNASGVGTGGYASGAGLNTIQDGSPALGNRSIYGVIQPYIKGLENLTDPNQVIDAIEYANGVKFTQDQANRIFDYLGVPHYRTSAVYTGQDILSALPNSGENTKAALQGMADEFGINALRGGGYSGTYSGITRRLGVQDAIGTNAGDAFINQMGQYNGAPSWSARMQHVNNAGLVNIPNDYRIFPDAYTKAYFPIDIQEQFYQKYNSLANSFYHNYTPASQEAGRLAGRILKNYKDIKTLGGVAGITGSLIGGSIGGLNLYNSRTVSPEDAKEYAKEIADDLYGGARPAGIEVGDMLDAQRRKLNMPIGWGMMDYPNLGQYGRAAFEQELFDKISKGSYNDANDLKKGLLKHK